MKGKILVVDDEEQIRHLLEQFFTAKNFDVSLAASGAALRTALAGAQPDVVLLDLRLGDANGLDLLPEVKRSWPETEVIILTGYGRDLETVVETIKRGAFHFQDKPFNLDALLALVERACERKRLTEETSALRRALSTMSGGAAPVFQSAAMKEVLRTAERIAPSDVSVLITGESGAGKEVIADLIHAMSPRAKGPFIKINCAALPRELIESELFGSVKGAFTGAQSDREGLFRQAEGGTLLLDELSEMPVDTQSKLLRILQDKEVRPVGGRTSYKIDCRILAATNRKTEEAIKDGKLREDLFYRISAITMHLPPLRDRREDITPLARAFLKRFAAQAGSGINGFTPEAISRIEGFDWPGNVRQLQNEVQRAVLMCQGSAIREQDLTITTQAPAAEGTRETEEGLTLMEAMERNTIMQVLQETGGNKLETAKRLGIGRQTLYNKIKSYGIKG